jgi:hypothetical protein
MMLKMIVINMRMCRFRRSGCLDVDFLVVQKLRIRLISYGNIKEVEVTLNGMYFGRLMLNKRRN